MEAPCQPLAVPFEGAELDGVLCHDTDHQTALLLCHGAGAGFQHKTMERLAQSLHEVSITTLRFNFPFMQAGKRRVDANEIATAAVIAAASQLRERVELPLFLGGHSFGARMTTHAALALPADLDVKGLVLCSFPLHLAKKPAIKRATHLPEVALPMLFLSGTRDALADRILWQEQVDRLGDKARLQWLETADHSYNLLKRQRPGVDVFAEMAEHVKTFVTQITG